MIMRDLRKLRRRLRAAVAVLWCLSPGCHGFAVGWCAGNHMAGTNCSACGGYPASTSGYTTICVPRQETCYQTVTETVMEQVPTTQMQTRYRTEYRTEQVPVLRTVSEQVPTTQM